MPAKLTLVELQNRLDKYNFILVSEYTNIQDKHTLICGYCGEYFDKKLTYILEGKIYSCGCKRGLKRRRGSSCVPGEYFGKLKRCAKMKKWDFNITLEYISELLIQQEFRCALSDIPIKLNYSTGIRQGTNTASLDRIDSNKGYVIGNVQWIHKDVNWMKQDFVQEYFIDLCIKIANKQG